jgi:hypothetical protein
MTTRRELLSRAALGIGAGAVAAAMPLRVRGQSASGDLTARIARDLETHAGFGDKFSGGPGDNATADWIAARLRRSGYAVEESSFDAPFFAPRAASLRTAQAAVTVVPQAPVVTTGPTGLTAKLALVDGDGASVGDVDGRIAIIVTPFGRHAALFHDRGIGQTVTAAAARGARGIVIVTIGPSGEAIALNAPEEPFVPVPTVVLAPKHAAAIIEAARRQSEATLVLDGDATHRPCKNILGRLQRGPRWVAVSTPRSGWYGCVAERGTGTAAFLELADWLVARFPELSVFVMNTGGHEYFFAGSHRVLDRAPAPYQTQAWVHVGATLAARDAVERDGGWRMLDTADPQRSLMASAAASGPAARAFSGISGLSEPTPVRPQAGELSAFTDRGYAAAFAVIGVHRWFHTVEDTLERVDAGLVTPVVEAHQRALELIIAGDGNA